MHDRMRIRALDKFVNELDLLRFRKLVAEARTPAELRMARSLLTQQEDINLELNIEDQLGDEVNRTSTSPV